MTDMLDRRQAAEAFCELATNGFEGRVVTDPIYRWVTERRDPGPIYSSCADLGHWLLRRLGCVESFVNRDEAGCAGYRIGMGPNLLLNAPGTEAYTGQWLYVGDILLSWPEGKPNSVHVSVFGGWVDSGDKILTWDYGQATTNKAAYKKGAIEARKNAREETWRKKIRAVLPLANVEFKEPRDLLTGELLDAIEKEYAL